MSGRITHNDLANPIRRGIIPVAKNWGVTPNTQRQSFIDYYNLVVQQDNKKEDENEGYKIKEIRTENGETISIYSVTRPFKINGLWMFADVEFHGEDIYAVNLKPSLQKLWESCKKGDDFDVSGYNENALPIIKKWLKETFGKPIGITEDYIIYDYSHRGIDLRAGVKKNDGEETPVRITIKYNKKEN